MIPMHAVEFLLGHIAVGVMHADHKSQSVTIGRYFDIENSFHADSNAKSMIIDRCIFLKMPALI